MSTKFLDTRLELKEVDASQRIISGWAAAIGNRDRVGDVIVKGAFDRTLSENDDILVLIGHDASRMPVGEVSVIRADGGGLYTESKVYDTVAGNELLEVARQRMARGKSLGMSIGYRVVADRWDPKQKARYLLDVDLVEYSFLASPQLAANPLAMTTGVKAGGTSLIEASYEDLQEDLRQAASMALGGMGWCCVCATYPDHVIVATMDEGEAAFWDFPYTLDAQGEPTLGEPKPVQQAFVPGAAKALEQFTKERRMPPTVKAEWTAAYVNNLPDSAFAFIEPGGTKDDGGLTTPRSLRHFPHHASDGAVDLPHLRNALARAPQSDFGDKAEAHLEAHAKAEGIGDRGDSGKALDPHSEGFAESAAGMLLVLSAKMGRLADETQADRNAMERLGIDTKKGARLNSDMRSKLKDLHSTLGQIISWAEAIEEGEDGKMRVDWFKHQLQLMELAEVA